MNRSRFNGARWRVLTAAALVCVVIGAAYFLVDRPHSNFRHKDAPDQRSSLPSKPEGGPPGSSIARVGASTSQSKITSWSLASGNAAASLGLRDVERLGTGRELVEFARRTDDPTLQLYSLWGASYVCKAYNFTTQDLKRFASFGAANPERSERILQQLMSESSDAAAGLRDRCAEFEANDQLRQQLIDEASRNRLPLFVAQEALATMQRQRTPDGPQVAEARAAVAQLMAVDRPATMALLLSRSLEAAARNRLADEFPTTAKEDWPLGPIAAAYQLAACRTHEINCGPGSLARDAVCARFGECKAADLESSYRRLFALYDIPFADTDRLANKLSAAMLARDVAILLR